MKQRVNLRAGNVWTAFIDYASQKGKLRLFVPWAAPPDGRAQPGAAENRTAEWLAGDNGLAAKLGGLIAVETVVMPADSYAERNGFDMGKAGAYWQLVQNLFSSQQLVEFVPSSKVEGYRIMDSYMAQDAYALEKLNEGTRQKVVAAAAKYTNLAGIEAYQSAADYAMRRAAEARFVQYDLQALWISLNWPERDAMCGDTPRVYAPAEMRTPWLQGGSDDR
jgi:hypothetical protein